MATITPIRPPTPPKEAPTATAIASEWYTNKQPYVHTYVFQGKAHIRTIVLPLLMSGVCILFLACVRSSPSRILDDCLYCHGVEQTWVKSS